MLTLTNPLTIEGFTVYHDDDDDIQAVLSRADAALERGRARIDAIDAELTGRAVDPAHDEPLTGRGARRFYVLPDKPAIAKDDDGKPLFSLVLYRRDEARIDPDKTPKEDAGGGILTFTVELPIPDQKMQRIRSRLRTLVYGERADDPTNDVEVGVVEFVEGRVSVAIAGEGTTDTGEAREFVKTAVGTGTVSGVGANRKAVMVKLTQDGAALLSQLGELRTLPINVQYDLAFEHRLLGVTVRVWCDVSSSYHLVQEVGKAQISDTDGGYLGSGDNESYANRASSVTEVLIRNKTAGVEVIPYSSQVDADTILALERFGQDMLAKEMEKVVEAKPPGTEVDRAFLTRYFSDVGNQLNFTLDRRMVLKRSYNPSTNLANLFTAGDLRELVAFVDLRTAFFSILKVPIRVNADFTKLPISSVTVTVSYRSRRPNDNVVEERTDSFDFTDGATIRAFVAYANTLDEVEYDWKAVVHYKDSQEPFEVRRQGVKDRFLVVDVGTMGLITTDISLGLVDLDKFPAATVRLRYTSRALRRTVEQAFTLNREKPNALWADVIREESSGSYEYKVDWLRKEDNAILEGDWQSSSALRLRLDAPVPDRMTISVVCTGNFKEDRDQIAHVLVSLRYVDAENDYVQGAQLDFTDDKQVLTWTVDLRNRELRDYQYRYSIVYKGGVVKHFPPSENDWLPGQPGFLTVGEKYGLEVALYPYLLQFGDRDKVVQVDMAYEDASRGVRAVDSFVFSKDSNKPQTWRVRADPQGPRSYTATITYFSAMGAPVQLQPRVAEADVLVIPPVPPAAPPT